MNIQNLVNPDFIYIDGPDQKDIQGNLNGIIQAYDFWVELDILKITFNSHYYYYRWKGANAIFKK